MKTELKSVKGIRKLFIDEHGTVYKDYIQESSGSAYKKIPGDVMLMDMAGYHDIELTFNINYPNKDVVLWYVQELNIARKNRYSKIKTKFI